TADKLEFPVESLNQAASYFLQKIPDFRKSLVEVYRGGSAVFYRPDCSLFIKLKIGRMSESDLSDCLEMIRYQKKSKKRMEIRELLALLDDAMIRAENQNKKTRLEHLKKELQKNQ
ncbi:MAG: hypothetical protein HQK54_16935, partial [Oligoflexales bacterium]|nr:hypothetical protein [Oligoflexales bacterium]